MASERTFSLDPILNQTGLGGKGKREKREKGRRGFRERVSTFSLDFPTIGPSNLGDARGKVDPHCTSNAWVPVLWSFDNSER